MTALVILIVLALLFGAGAVAKGILWLGLIAAAFAVLGLFTGWKKLTNKFSK